jgi:flagellar basal body P-ring formation protein FlgA
VTTLAVMNRLLLTLLALALSVACASGARAATALQETIRLRALHEAAAAAGGTQSRIDVVVGEIDPRLQLAACDRPEVFLPAGGRFWGRVFAAVRCVEGATWSIRVPVTVRVFGPALVARRTLMAGVPIDAGDVRTAEVEWTREPLGVVTSLAQLEQQVLGRVVAVGQPIALNALRAPQAVGQGEPVRVVGHGRGFSITADAVALASASAGQSVRVRTDAGKILTGIARPGRLVEVQF